VLLKTVKPPNTPLNVLPVLEKTVPLPAVALLLKTIPPSPPDPSTTVTKFCVIGPTVLLVMPVPVRVKLMVGSALMVKACVSEALKVIAAIVVLAETKSEFTLDKLLNVAVSPAVVPG
jgi:hypothetical protein